MAKELPYFKFEPNEWENGNIQMLSREDKGLFIDLCCMYWSRLGDLPYRLAIQKVCGGNANALNPLFEDDIISVDENDIIVISFLQEQLSEFSNISNQNSKNAKDGWEKRRKQKELSERNANAYDSQSESDAIREDKRREDEIKEKNNNNKIPDFQSFLNHALTKEPNIDEVDLRKKYDAWINNDWHNGNGKKITAWKRDLNSTIPYIKKKPGVIIETQEQMLKRRFAKS